MKSGDPLNSLASAMHDACLVNLPDFEYDWRQPGSDPVSTIKRKRRPNPMECEFYLFPQTWGSTALGFGGIGGQAITASDTVVVIGPNNAACVYFPGRFAYRINKPNMKFFQDMASYRMNTVSGASKAYETPAKE